MKVGDLVRCPGGSVFDPERAIWVQNRSPDYIGVIIGVYGHKVEVLGGDVVSWDGIKGKKSWDIADLSLIEAK